MADKGGFDITPVGHSDTSQTDAQAIQTLLRRGYSMEAILRLAQDGKLNAQAQQGASLPNGQYFNPSDFGTRSGGLEQTRTQIGGKLNDIIRGQGANPLNYGIGNAAAPNRSSSGTIRAGRTDTNKNTAGPSPKGKAGTISRAVDAMAKYQKIFSAFKGAQQGGAGSEGISIAPPAAPDVSQFSPQTYTPPVLQRRDFTDQANQLAAQAYGPMYEALNLGKQNATGQYNTSDTVVKGLYDRLSQEIASAAEKQKQGYDQSGADASARYAALQDQIGQNYAAAQGQENNLLQQNGLQAAAGDVLPDDRAFQQAEAAKQGTAQQDYYAAQGQASQDYMGKLGIAGQTEGNVQRQNLVQQLSNVLNQYDQQNLQLKGQQAQTAMDIGNRLSDQDFQLQQANAGLQTDAFNANSSNQMNLANLAQQSYANGYQQYRDQVGDQQFGQQQGLNEQKFRLDAATAAAQVQGDSGGLGLKFNELPPQQQVVAQADQLTPGQGQQYYDFVNQFMSGQDPNQYNLQTFSTAVAQAAAARGLNPSVAMAIAGSYWNRIMNRS